MFSWPGTWAGITYTHPTKDSISFWTSPWLSKVAIQLMKVKVWSLKYPYPLQGKIYLKGDYCLDYLVDYCSYGGSSSVKMRAIIHDAGKWRVGYFKMNVIWRIVSFLWLQIISRAARPQPYSDRAVTPRPPDSWSKSAIIFVGFFLRQFFHNDQ